jgi:aminopeptidase N
MSTRNRTKYWRDYQPPAWLVTHTEITCDIDAFGFDKSNTVLDQYLAVNQDLLPLDNLLATQVTAKLSVERNRNATTTSRKLLLNGHQIPILASLYLNDQPLDKSHLYLDEDGVVIDIENERALITLTTIIFPKLNTECEGLYDSNGILVTQMEAHGFQRFIYFPDRPDVLSTYRITLTAPQAGYPVLLANGNKEKAEHLPGNRHSVTFFDPWLKPCYLVAIVAGKLSYLSDVYTTKSNKPVQLKIYGEERQLERLSFAMECLHRCIKWDEEQFDFEYDLDEFIIVATSNFNAGAMENKGLNIFNDRLLVGDLRSASDDRLERIDRVIAHEYFHNRTGNRVTCRSWFELTLKEGLTVLRDTMYGESTYDSTITRIETVRTLRQFQFPEDLGANRHPIRMESMVSVDNFYTATVYNKGAEVIRMAIHLIGREKFIEGVKHYCRKYDCQAVTCEAFWSALTEVSHYDFSKFYRWYYQAGLPEIIVTPDYSKESKQLTLIVKQNLTNIHSERGEVLPFVVPIKLAALGQDGLNLNLTDSQGCSKIITEDDDSVTIISSEWEEKFVFDNVDTKPAALSLLRQFSSPVLIKYSVNEKELLHLLRFDSDLFNRYEAAENLKARAIRKIYDHLSTNPDSTHEAISAEFSEAMVSVINSDEINLGLKSYLIKPPALTELGLLYKPLDYPLLAKARELFLTEIANRTKLQLQNLLEQTLRISPLNNIPHLNKQTCMMARLARKACLELLWYCDQSFVNEQAIDLIRRAPTMSDELCGLALLNYNLNEYTAEANETFINRWQAYDDIVPDWFLFQVINLQTKATTTVEQLSRSKFFQSNNPNYLRALYGGFARNLPAFHSPCGSGYDLVAEAIIDIAERNALLAARLGKLFDDYPRLSLSHKALMRNALLKIRNFSHKGLESLQEVISKTLEC